MTQEPGATKTLSTILKNSATISTQQVQALQNELKSLRTRVEQQEMELMKLRKMNLYYRPPNGKEHLKLTEALNQMWEETFKEKNMMKHIEGDSFIKSKGIKSPEDIG
ncbi:MAG: hypothetical protein CM15mV4_3090 [Caudoviricetes sp.]|nr:MAG: hypothetical protein CM15mV4_3090 [Caudoviricetes sp.]